MPEVSQVYKSVEDVVAYWNSFFNKIDNDLEILKTATEDLKEIEEDAKSKRQSAEKIRKKLADLGNRW